jgi:metal-responsive CopG/Arc/MetJ family transcriptional regulator
MRPGLPHRQQKSDANRRLVSIELPPDILDRMDAVLEPGETREDFVRAATRNEIARRKAERGERDT